MLTDRLPRALHSSTSEVGPASHRALRAYFRSGWAFLIPYLAAYLLYAWLKWPVNPASGGEGIVKGISESAEPSSLLLPPALLHVYWGLHAINLILGVIALRAWWFEGRKEKGERGKEQDNGKPETGDRRPESSTPTHQQSTLDSQTSSTPASSLQSPAHRLPPTAYRLLPWLCLALLFWIPGVYMEFPADPWQHYARTNEWSWHTLVTEHSFWKKSGTFLAYSFIGRISPALLQLKFFDLYYTGCCLLLCWQYYRLARAIGLSERISLLFVLINVLTFGNNIFGFYRYYGMSSTLFAQLGAVALTRIAIEMARGRPEIGDRRPEAIDASESTPMALGWFSRLSRGSPDPASGENAESVERAISRLPTPVSRLLQLAGFSMLLLPLIAFNHIQGLGIAAMGITAVVVWRLIAWRKVMLLWLVVAGVLLSVATVLWYPRNALLDSLYRTQGWMSPWYGFPLFQPGTPGFDRAWVVLGAFGGLNLLAGLWLVLRNRIEGWLTLMPVLLLALPVGAIPFASVLAGSTDVGEDGYVMAYHRMLFAIPCGLAACALIGRAWERVPGGSAGAIHPHSSSQIRPGFALMVGSLAFFTLLPAGGPALNRLYNGLMIPADDLAMRHVLASAKAMELRKNVLAAPSASRLAEVSIENSRLLANPAVIYVLSACGAMYGPNAEKNQISHLSISATQYAEGVRIHGRTQPTSLLIPATEALYTVSSPAATLSRHWLSHAVALDHGAQPQLASLPAVPRPPPQVWLQWFSPRDNSRFFAKGAGKDFSTPPRDERGRLDLGIGNQLVQAGDRVVFQPVMRTYDSSGVSLHFRILGPGVDVAEKVQGRPGVVDGSQWTYQDIPITLKEPGRYDIEVTGIILGHKGPWIVRHHLIVKEPDTRGIQ